MRSSRDVRSVTSAAWPQRTRRSRERRALRILTVEHISPIVARHLYALGYDVIHDHDRGLLGKKDWELMAWCIADRPAICTINGDDLEREHHRCQFRDEDHYGVLVVGDWTTDEIYWALLRYLESRPDPDLLVNQIIDLPPASADFSRECSPPQS